MRSIFESVNNKDQVFMEKQPRILFPLINNPLGSGGGVLPEEATFYKAQYPPQEDLSFNFYKFYQINPDQVPITETNYSLRIHKTLGADIFQSQFDLKIFDQDGTELSYEREFINELTGEFAIWVEFPTATDGRFIQINVGKAGVIVDPSTVVFNANHKRVYHLADLTGKDSSVNVENATKTGNVIVQDGPLGPELIFNPSSPIDGHFDFPVTSLPDTGEDRTISALVRIDIAVSAARRFAVLYGSNASDASMGFATGFTTGELDYGSDVGLSEAVLGGLLPTDKYHHVVYTFSASSNKMFIDGIKVNSFNRAYNIILAGGFIGSDFSNGEFWRDAIKEVRVLDIEQTQNSITIDNNNQKEDDMFWNESPLIPTGGADILYVDHLGKFYVKNLERKWAFEVEVNVLAAKVAGTQNAFPTMIYIASGSPLANELIGKSAFVDGHDIRPVILEDEEIPYELVNFNNDTGELFMFVSSDIDDVIGGTFKLLFDNPASGADKSDGPTVFSEYLAVYHMQELPVTNGILKDSTGVNNGTFSNVLTQLPVQIPGTKRPKALQFNISSDPQFVDIPDPIGEAFDTFDKCSIFADAIADESVQPVTFPPVVGQSNSDTAAGLRWSLIKRKTSNLLGGVFSGTTITGGPWDEGDRIIGTVQKNQAISDVSIFSGGLPPVSTVNTDTIQAASINARIGASSKTISPDFFKGIIQEIRLALTQFSNDYIKTDFNNQNDPSLFYNITDPVLVNTPSNWGDTAFPRRIGKIIADGKVPSPVSNFPLKIIFPIGSDEANALTGNVQTQGQDIRVFLDDKTPIPFEIQNIDSGTGELFLYCLVPTAKVGTRVYVNFGNASATDAQDAPAVWTDYLAVYHLQELPTVGGFIKDSTGNFNTAFSLTAARLPTRITGFNSAFALAFDQPGTETEFIQLPSALTTAIGSTNKFIDFATFNRQGSSGFNNSFIAAIANDLTVPGSGGFVTGYGTRTDNNNIRSRLNGTLETPTNIAVGVWNIGCMSYDGTLLSDNHKMFHNGSLIAMRNVTGVVGIGTGEDMTIGASVANENGQFDGFIQEVRIGQVIFSPEYLETDFNNRFDPDTFFITQKVEVLP